MPNARRFALTALLLVGSAGLAAVVATRVTPAFAGGRVPAAADLPWPSTLGPADRRLPFALLYVDSHCMHCSRAAVLVDSLVAAHSLRLVIVSNDTRADADAYRDRLGLHSQLALDSASALMTALGTRAVPTLVLFHRDGLRQLLVGFTHDAPYREALERFAQ